MKHLHNILFLLSIGLSTSIFGQMAIVDGEDGYVEVYAKPDTAASVLMKVNNGHVVYWDDYVDEGNSFARILISTDTLSTGNAEISYQGYTDVKNLISLQGDFVKSEIEGVEAYNLLIPFDTTQHNIRLDTVYYRSSGKRIYYMEDRHFGTDGVLPKTELLDIYFKVDGQIVTIPQVLQQDLFNLDEEYRLARLNDLVIATQWNSDGAGAYQLTFVIKDGNVIQRLVGTIY